MPLHQIIDNFNNIITCACFNNTNIFIGDMPPKMKPSSIIYLVDKQQYKSGHTLCLYDIF